MTNLKSLSRPNRILKTNDPTSRLLSLTHRKRKKEKKTRNFIMFPLIIPIYFSLDFLLSLQKKKKIPTSPHFIAAEYYLESEARSTDRCMTGI